MGKPSDVIREALAEHGKVVSSKLLDLMDESFEAKQREAERLREEARREGYAQALKDAEKKLREASDAIDLDSDILTKEGEAIGLSVAADIVSDLAGEAQ